MRRLLALLLATPALLAAQSINGPPAPLDAPLPTLTATPTRPFGTLREQAALQQRWLELRMERILPALMRRYGVSMWVVPMREYNEDPVFKVITSPVTFAARRRTIYVFFDRGAEGIERIALGGTSQGGVFKAVRSTKAVASPAAGSKNQDRTAELWGDDQWQVLKQVIIERNPKNIALNISRTFAFADGLTAGEYEGMREALGEPWVSRITRAEGLAVDFIASRLPEEEPYFREMNRVIWEIIDEAFSNRVITPGVTRTADVEWWMRQKLQDLGVGTWFAVSVEVQRQLAPGLPLVGPNPVILEGDVLHTDFGMSVLGLNTDTQHMGYVLKAGETTVPAGIQAALGASNRLQDFVMEETRPGRTGNEVLKAALGRMRAAGIDGTIYSHPIGAHGHGAGPLIGLWDYQDGVPGRGDHTVIPNMWFSVELQATSPVPEWGGQGVRSAQEEDMVVGADGKTRWSFGRQTTYHLVRPKGPPASDN
ncbi:MAG: aminopeptidase P family protein [Gemmatimonadaceae bacterium]|nr:aminopeptidase P family protein [Gemmatimonadaceae bacterium]